jgi:hypothetical protein
MAYKTFTFEPTTNRSFRMKEQSENNPFSQFLSTEGGKTKSNAIEIPSVSIPKGGGALKGIDETFAVNAMNGTSLFSVPFPFSRARGTSPALGLSYNSGINRTICEKIMSLVCF